MTLRVGVAGFGTIGAAVARALDRGIEGLALGGVTARNPVKVSESLRAFSTPVPVLPIEELVAQCEVIVESVPAAAFEQIALPALRAGRLLLTVSGAALLAHPEVIDIARRHGGRIVVATGALLGLDALRAAAEGSIRSVRMVTRKPPRALAGSPYLAEHGIDLRGLSAPLKVFEGNAADGARGFPSNVNVAAAVGLAGIGAEATRLEIWADPALTRNTHEIEVDADSARFTMRIENVPSESNPATGRITALSVIAALRSLGATLRVGT
jgi:aspartate dehydrogenase